MRKKIKLNMKFNKGSVVCARSPGECKQCVNRKDCEYMVLYYYPFRDFKECFKNSEKKT
jgi:hypothetical protein